ncbi:HhH-GDP family DNA glycosylase [Histidinibacterium aquaticum]|uniref:Endonuclease n=1 Tax=Histidinibacterium aquaticum TaxID=2613962 RepID=A0A5J5GCZ4_9RHOB|nr:hypothetical protein [Histidinibacterium aquaticum]KAA9006056.1 hypothetical protein F3S47_16010 [Histidinibacterium aquaticum]
MTRKQIVDALIAEQGKLYSEEMGANIARDTPQELFHWLIGSIMLSARIGSELAVQGCAALRDADLHKIDRILEADRTEIVRCLNENGYARYDESTADYIIDTARMVRDAYGDDLRRMREENPRQAVQKAKGLGPTGAGIFAREVQLVWDEFLPEVGKPAQQEASELGLPEDGQALLDLAGDRERFVRLVAALTRAKLEGPADKVKEAAA